MSRTAGAHSSAPAGKSNSGGMTPMISAGRAFAPSPIVIDFPTIDGSPEKRRRQRRALSTTVAGAPGASSSGRNVRPSIGRAPSVSKNDPDTELYVTANGSPGAVMR
jgi:hypothetical protein